MKPLKSYLCVLTSRKLLLHLQTLLTNIYLQVSFNHPNTLLCSKAIANVIY